MKHYQQLSKPQRRARKAAWRKRNNWMPHFAEVTRNRRGLFR